MFDTNIFNHVLDNSIDLLPFIGRFEAKATHIQSDELNATRDQQRRDNLNRLFGQIAQDTLPTESAVYDVSKWGQVKWSKKDSLYSQIRDRLDNLKKKPNNIQDALIAESAIINRLVLVSDDENLKSVTHEFGGEAIALEEFIEYVKSAECAS